MAERSEAALRAERLQPQITYQLVPSLLAKPEKKPAKKREPRVEKPKLEPMYEVDEWGRWR